MTLERDRSFYREQLEWLKRVQEKTDPAFPVLVGYQRAFIAALNRQLHLPPWESAFLGSLALASAQEPVSVTEAIAEHIAELNQVLPERVGLRIRQAVNEQGQEIGFYLGPRSDIVLSERASKVMRLLAAGFSGKEIASEMGLSTATIKNMFTPLYQRLHVQGALGAALLLLEEGILDTQPIRRRFDLVRFGSLTGRQREVLDTLITVGDLGNNAMADELGLSGSSVKNHLLLGAKTISAEDPPNRVALGVGYWIYQQEIATEAASASSQP